MDIGDHNPQKPKLKHLLGRENIVLSIFVRGHLVLEAILNNLLQLRESIPEAKINQLTCAKKIDRSLELSLISGEMHDFLSQINKIRNRFTHRLGYNLTDIDVHELIKLAGKVPEIEFTDDMHLLDTKTLYEWYDNTAGVLEEMFKHSALDLSYVVQENGGEAIFET